MNFSKILVIPFLVSSFSIFSAENSFSSSQELSVAQKNDNVVCESKMPLKNIPEIKQVNSKDSKNKLSDKGFDLFNLENSGQFSNKEAANFFKNIMFLIEDFFNLSNLNLKNNPKSQDLKNPKNYNSEHTEKAAENGFRQWGENYQWKGLRTEKNK
ncbi:MAG: hypothetical protein ABIG64_06170 [Candidatus Omnitrophota bacterium]